MKINWHGVGTVLWFLSIGGTYFFYVNYWLGLISILIFISPMVFIIGYCFYKLIFMGNK